MKELYSGKFAPITDTIGFLQCDAKRAVAAFLDWQNDIQSTRGVSLSASCIAGDFPSAIKALLPLTSVERRRYLFAPTDSNWTVFLDNGHKGTDAFSHLSYLAERLACNAVRMTYVSEGREDSYPATIFKIYGPYKTDFLNIVRSISCAVDGGRWVFSAEGEVQPFENVERYSERSIKNRFTGEMLEAYLSQLGIRAFEEGFYMPSNMQAVLAEKEGPIAPSAREFELICK